MFRRNKLFFWTAEILLLTLIFYLWREMGAIITPFVTVVNTIMIPLSTPGMDNFQITFVKVWNLFAPRS